MKINATLIGTIIKDVRTLSNISTNAFAKAANIPQSALSRIENPPKPDFRVSYDTLVNAVEYAANLEVVTQHDFDFEQYRDMEDAEETISFFVMFIKEENLYNKYLKKQNRVQSSFVDEHIHELSKPVWEALDSYLRSERIKKRMRNKIQELHNKSEAEMHETFYRYLISLNPDYESTFDKDETYFLISIKADDKTLEELIKNPSAESASAFAESMLDEMSKKR